MVKMPQKLLTVPSPPNALPPQIFYVYLYIFYRNIAFSVDDVEVEVDEVDRKGSDSCAANLSEQCRAKNLQTFKVQLWHLAKAKATQESRPDA